MTGPEAARRLGITYRQLDHWYHRGFLGPDSDNRKRGSGNERRVTLAEFQRATALSSLVHAGIRADLAAKHLDNATITADALTIHTDQIVITISRNAA